MSKTSFTLKVRRSSVDRDDEDIDVTVDVTTRRLIVSVRPNTRLSFSEKLLVPEGAVLDAYAELVSDAIIDVVTYDLIRALKPQEWVAFSLEGLKFTIVNRKGTFYGYIRDDRGTRCTDLDNFGNWLKPHLVQAIQS